MKRTSFPLLIALALAPGLSFGQSVSRGASPKCARKIAADSGKVVLADSAAPATWGRQALTSIARHEICVGMTKDMVRKSWGLPANLLATYPNTPGDTTAQFFYKAATVVFVNSKLRAIRPPSELRRP